MNLLNQLRKKSKEVNPTHKKIIACPIYDQQNDLKINQGRVGDFIILTFLCEDGLIITQEHQIVENDRSITMKEMKRPIHRNAFKIKDGLEEYLLECNDTDEESI